MLVPTNSLIIISTITHTTNTTINSEAIAGLDFDTAANIIPKTNNSRIINNENDTSLAKQFQIKIKNPILFCFYSTNILY